MNKMKDESINLAIRENEKNAPDWELSDLADRLYWWVDYFNFTFFKDQPVPVPVISFERTNVNNLGHYVIGRNAIGVKENININNVHLKRPLWEILATLLHELTHSWQASYGRPSNNWYHNNEFRSKMREFGIFTNKKGCHIKVGDPFVAVLKGQGIEFVDVDQSDGIIILPPTVKPKGKSKLKKWSCGCTNIRVAVKDFEAKCLRCGNLFELGS